MTVNSIITDPSLQAVLEISIQSRLQSLSLFDFTGANPISPSANPPATLETTLSKQQKILYARLAQLRGANRNALLSVRNAKQVTAEARQEVDRLHLQLQNLYYEQRHLRGEISSCESYNHKYQQLPLIPVEEFLERFPEHEDDNNDELMVARISHEHTERESLEQERQRLLKKKQSLIADNKKRKDDLASLDADLEKFIDAAKPIQKIFEKES